MKILCREDHDFIEDRCPPHQFDAAGWEDTNGLFQSRIYCKLCGDIRELEVPTIGPIYDPTPLHRTAEDGGRRAG